MIEIGAFEAKTHFSQLLANVAKGETIGITKHGIRVAVLSPAKEIELKVNCAADAVEAIRTLRKGVTLGKALTIKKMRAEGRR